MANTQVFCQLKATTQTGRLFFKKEAPQNIKKTGPAIIVKEPLLGNNKIIQSQDKNLAVRVEVIDESEIGEVLFNGKKAAKISASEYYYNVILEEGLNIISVTAKDKNNTNLKTTFSVNYLSDAAGPVVKITEPAVSRGIKIVRKNDIIKIRGIAEDESGVKEVLVNNRTADLSPLGEFSIDMALEPGENKFTVRSVDNRLNFSVDTFTVTRRTEDLINAGKYVALVIGINSYQGYWTKLNSAVNDASEVGKVLKEEYLFNDVISLLDKDATRRNIIQKLEWLTSNITKDDNVLIFYAGHGQFNKSLNKGYWVPVDATTNSTADYISNNDIKTFLAALPSKHTLLITDACFAGDIFRGQKSESIQMDPNNMDKYFKEVYRKSSRLAITSGGVEEVADEWKDGHSIFTYYLLKSLRENQSTYFDANQLFNDFRIAVSNNSEQTPMLQAVRDTGDEGGSFIFIKKPDSTGKTK